MNKNGCCSSTILFADIAGSVKFYDAHGDSVAHGKIIECLESMSIAIAQHQGQVKGTIGDEIMCLFSDPNSALSAACAIQAGLHLEPRNELAVRIGFHHGTTGFDSRGDPFGDTVNIAARMVDRAKAGQIVMSQQAFDQLSSSNVAHVRPLERVYIKGKSTPINTYEMVWDERESTLLRAPFRETTQERRRPLGPLQISYGDSEQQVTASMAEFTIGHATICDLIVTSKMASRVHATLRCQTDKIILKDHSTNGTFLQTPPGRRIGDGIDLFIHNEECVLQGSAVISLGEPIASVPTHLIHIVP